MDSVTTDNKKVSFKLSTFVAMVFGIVTSTFTVTTIYNTFLFMGNEITTNNTDSIERDDSIIEAFTEKDINTNGRIDKITKRLELRIEELEKPNTDKNK